MKFLQINENVSKKYFHFLRSFYKLDTRIKSIPVDFAKPWFQVYLDQKWRVLIALFMWCSALAWDTIGTLVIAYSIQQKSTWLFSLALLGYFIRFTLSYIALTLAIYVEKNTNLSIQYFATKYFLTVDPVFHSTRSSGQVISKVARGAEAYNTFGVIVIFSVSAVVMSTIISTTILFISSPVVGFVGLSINLIFGAIAVLAILNSNRALNPRKIEKEDEQKALQVESLQQISLIRSSFGTIEQAQKVSKNALITGIYTGTKDLGTTSIFTAVLYLLIGGVAIIGFLLLNQVQLNKLDPIIAVGMITIYIDSLNKIMNLSNQAEKLITSMSNAQDLFTFIRGFGRQTYPVLEGDEIDIR
jgi:ABC-type multidrug transport system fused ATPase/permease subunit